MPKRPQKTGEADFKAGVFQEYFGTKKFTYRQEIDRIDFIITDQADRHLIWAETKKNAADITEMFVQLILTIGKARTFDRFNPPPFLCAFDYEKIAFLHYDAIHDVFYQNDFNWNVTPSDHKSKEFQQIKSIVEKTVEDKNMLFSFDKDKQVLKEFIKNNFTSNPDLFSELTAHLQIDKNNFVPVYNRWAEMVKPSIAIDWDVAKKKGIIDGDFYLADLLSEDNITFKEKLFVFLRKSNYELDRQMDDMGLFTIKTVQFKDGGMSHRHFWEIYVRPPKEEYWDYIVDRRDLLVPQDIRERKGSFFTPQIWVQKSQEYLTDVFGENWQDEYYVWDCAAGTGNLLVGLTNKYNIWASTLDRQDVDVMHDRVKNGANLLDSHVFQFDFLNDSFDKLPEGLKDIIDDPEKRKKLVIYINPPYAEAANHGERMNKAKVTSAHKTSEKYKHILGRGINELFANFFIRIYHEIPNIHLASFSTLKYLNSQNFIKFRQYFHAEYKEGFICPANSFDNVNGNFPICFLIWNLSNKKPIVKTTTNILSYDDKTSQYIEHGIKSFYATDTKNFIIDWLRTYFDYTSQILGYMRIQGVDFQQNNTIFITSKPSEADIRESKIANITSNNIIEMCIYFAVRHNMEHTWINHNDQFLYPKNEYKADFAFQNDCLVFALFYGKNSIQSQYGVNHWIPFTPQEVGASDNFKSSFMSDFLKGKTFSNEASETLKAGRELWAYYHSKIAGHRNALIDASFYDIREFFQGRSEKGVMKQKSDDAHYNVLIKDLRQKLTALAEKIKPKVYEYGFLLE